MSAVIVQEKSPLLASLPCRISMENVQYPFVLIDWYLFLRRSKGPTIQILGDGGGGGWAF